MRTKKPIPPHNLKTTRSGTVKKRNIFWRWRRLFYLAFLSFTVLVAGAVYVVSRVELPGDPSIAPTEQQTSFICSAEVQVNCNAGNAMAKLHGAEDRSLVSYQQIPPVLREAVLSAEDRAFFKHGGVDPVGIGRAAWSDIRGKGAKQGGSTITQQYVKNTYLNRERTLTRKIKEAVMAVKLEQKLSKQEILTRYLNTIYFGRGAYGVQAASRAWFGHDVESVSLTQAAFLAGLIRSPQSADPYKGDKALAEATRRRHVVLLAMVDQKFVTARQQRDAEQIPLRFPLIAPPPVTANLGTVAGDRESGTKYFVEYVRRYLVRQFGEAAVYGGGLKVYTTLDRNMQKAAYDAVTTTLDRPDDPAGALVAVDDKGQVKAMMGGTNYEQSHVNLAVGRDGGGSGRQPGSTFKAFALAEAVREGYSVKSVFRSPTNIEIPNGQGPGVPWKVNGGFGNGTATLVDATKHSVNTVYAQLADRLGMDKVITMARQLGVSKTAQLPDVASLVLGTGSVSVLDMASAYSTFVDEGRHLSPIVVTRVERPDGSVVNFTPEGTQVLAPDQAARVNYCLQQVVQGGTGVDANFGHPAGGKTGTTQNNVDAWFVGFTPKLTAAVWMGYPSGNRSMDNVHGIKIQGGTLPAEMWRKFMQAVSGSTDTGTFPDPGDLNVGIQLNPGLSRSTSSSVLSTHRSRRSRSTQRSPSTSQPRFTKTTTSRPPRSTTTSTAPKSTTTRPKSPPSTRPKSPPNSGPKSPPTTGGKSPPGPTSPKP